MDTNNLPLQQALHIRSQNAGGWLYASANDLKEGDHVVELSPVRSDDPNYLWTIIPNPNPPAPVYPDPLFYPSQPDPGPGFFIKNSEYGYMFAADSDVATGHFVECNPTYDAAQNGGDKWIWYITGNDPVVVKNKLYGVIVGFDSGGLEGKSVQAMAGDGYYSNWILEIP
jgi:hypothetical protein